MKLLDFIFSIVLFLLAIFVSGIGDPRDFICFPSTHINKNCDILACSTMATTYVNTVCYEPNTGINQRECKQQSKRTELRSEKFLYEKSITSDVLRSCRSHVKFCAFCVVMAYPNTITSTHTQDLKTERKKRRKTEAKENKSAVDAKVCFIIYKF